MRIDISSERRGGSAIPLIVLFYFLTALSLEAQPGTFAPPGPPKADQGSLDKIPATMLLFNIRSAFSLTPSMVKLLQSRAGEKDEKSIEESGEAAPQALAEPTAGIAWTETLARNIPVAAPLDLRLMGKNLIVIVQLLPIAFRDPIVDLFVHGQIWLTTQDNSISYKTTMQSMSIPLGSRIYFYPLGADLKSGAPVAVEIWVNRP